jgi:hypothetical protein
MLHVRRAVGNTGAMCVSGFQPRQIQVGLICDEPNGTKKSFVFLSKSSVFRCQCHSTTVRTHFHINATFMGRTSGQIQRTFKQNITGENQIEQYFDGL